MSDCIFCKIISGEISSSKIYEDEYTFAFLDITPVAAGHTIVIPKKHARNIFDIDPGSWAHTTGTVQHVAQAVKNGVHADGINIGMNNESAAGQVVFHPHIHIIPRFEHDGLELWHGKPYEHASDMEEYANKIRPLL